MPDGTQTAKTANSRRLQLPTWRALAFAAPAIPFAWLIPPVYAILGDFYLRYTAATAAGVGTAMILSKVVDAITDPPVGYLSDHTKTPIGARKPWMMAGALVAMVTFYFLFNPPEGAGNMFFMVNIVMYYISFTMIMIPYRAWLGEITTDYAERSRVWSFVTMGLLIGGVIFMLLPVLLSLPAVGMFESAEFAPEMMSFLGWVGIVAMPFMVGIAVALAPKGTRNVGRPPTLVSFSTVVTSCPPYQIFLLSYVFSNLGFGIFYSVIIVALSSYWGIADRIPLFLLVMTGVQVLSIPMWERLGARFTKHRTWAVAWIIHACLGPFIVFFPPTPDIFWPLVAYGALASIMQAPHMLFPVSIVNDIVDYDTLKTGQSRAGNFVSVYTFFDKVVTAVGFGIGYYLLAIFGYDPKISTHSFWEVFGLMSAVSFVPTVFFALSAFFLFKYPIDRRRHDIIRRRLADTGAANQQST